MSNQLFTTVPANQAEKVSGGRFTFTIGGSLLANTRTATLEGTQILFDPATGDVLDISTVEVTDDDEVVADATSGSFVSNTNPVIPGFGSTLLRFLGFIPTAS